MRPSIAARANLDLIEENYTRWQRDPESVDSGWAAFFEGFELGDVPDRDGAATKTVVAPETSLQSRVDGLVYAYRVLGHTIARANPLAEKRRENPLLTLRELGFSEKDLDLRVSSKFFEDNRQMTLRDMIAALELGVAPARIASSETGCSSSSANGLAAGITGSGIVRDVLTRALRWAETFLASRRRIADGDSRRNSAEMPRCGD